MTETIAGDRTRLATEAAKILEPLKRKIDNDDDTSKSSYANTLVCLCGEVLSTFIALVDAHSRSQLQHTAWLSRNLLELMIWCAYCASSESNAQIFSRDAMKDALGIVNAFEKLGSMIPVEDSTGAIVGIRRKLTFIANAESFELDDEFKRVNEAAKELSSAHHMMFRNLNIILSKLTHPTAYMVNVYVDDPSKPGFIDMIYKMGSALASAALDALQQASILADS